MSFKENLRKYRELAGYPTAKEFANVLTNTSYDAYIGYENKGREPKYSMLVEIAQKLNVTIDELLDNTRCRRKQEQKMTEQLGVMIGLMQDSINTMKDLLKIIETEQNKRVYRILEDTTARIDKTLDSHKLSLDDFRDSDERLARRAIKDFDNIMFMAGIKDKKEHSK